MSAGMELARAWVRVGVDGSDIAPGMQGVQVSINTALSEAQSAAQRGMQQVMTHAQDSVAEIQAFAQRMLGNLGFGDIFGDARAMMGEAQARTLADKRLESSWIATKNAIGMSLDELKEWGKEWEKTTNFDGTKIIDTMSSLLTYTALTKEEMQKVMDTAMDITAQYGGDLKMNVQQIAKMLSNPLDKHVGLGKLGQQGYYITPEQRERMKKAQDQKDEGGARGVLMEVLSGQEGAAQRIAGPLTPLKELKMELGDLREKIGGELNQAFKSWEMTTTRLNIAKTELVGLLARAFRWFAELDAMTNNWMSTFGALVVVVLGGGVLVLSLINRMVVGFVLLKASAFDGFTSIARGFAKLKAAFIGFSLFMRTNPLGLLLMGAVGIATAVGLIWAYMSRSKQEAEAETTEEKEKARARVPGGLTVDKESKEKRMAFLALGQANQDLILNKNDVQQQQLEALTEGNVILEKVETAVKGIKINQPGLT